MKITDIISETLNPLTLVAKGLGKGASAAERIAPKLIGRTEFVDKAADQILSISKAKGISAEEAAKYVFKDANTVRQEQAAIDAFMKKNPGVTRERAASRLGVEERPHPLSHDAKAAKEAISKAEAKRGYGMVGLSGPWDAIDHFAGFSSWAVPLYLPYSQFRDNMKAAAANVESGAETKEQYQTHLEEQLGLMLAKWGEIIVMKKIFNALTPNKDSKIFAGMAKKFPNFTSAAGNTVDTAFYAYMMSDNGAATGVAGFLFDMMPGVHQAFGKVLAPFWAMLPNAVTPGAGPNTKPADKPTTNGNADPATGQGNKPAADTDTQQAPMSTDQLLGNLSAPAADLSKWQEIPSDPRWIRNPADPMQIALKPQGWKKP